MAKKLSPVLITLIYDALLKTHWYKGPLKLFLRTSGVSESYIARLDANESKRVWLDRLFPLLTEHAKGTDLMMKMARSLAIMTHFPGLSGVEDAPIKIAAARLAVSELAQAIGSETDKESEAREADEVKKKAAERLVKSLRQHADLEKLKSRMDKLSATIGTQQTGYDFETWFYDLLSYEDVECRRPYIIGGRQIDGSITLDGTTYLVELKFEAKQSGAPSIDCLKAKIASKSDNTMGIMVAMSGYSSVAIHEASGSKSVILMFDYSHIYMVLSGITTMQDLIRRVRRHSSQTGMAFLPAADFGG